MSVPVLVLFQFFFVVIQAIAKREGEQSFALFLNIGFLLLVLINR